jgi:hypothetical protein
MSRQCTTVLFSSTFLKNKGKWFFGFFQSCIVFINCNKVLHFLLKKHTWDVVMFYARFCEFLGLAYGHYFCSKLVEKAHMKVFVAITHARCCNAYTCICHMFYFPRLFRSYTSDFNMLQTRTIFIGKVHTGCCKFSRRLTLVCYLLILMMFTCHFKMLQTGFFCCC